MKAYMIWAAASIILGAAVLMFELRGTLILAAFAALWASGAVIIYSMSGS